ncbi:MAG: undecaprenyl/decaprenyl-phosphate alpha-N-acetylglucosaminyl 1-phosphate transferase [Candidatus Riflebacteria bacterium]|nr:undecaprenyl/decaprenyl-phosphate alpha-N-acetylglucosaminyl 1-phosphate transferase [Candidatus Riflebacteria bacterium]
MAVFLGSLVASLAATPVAKRVALRLGFVDRPGGRKIHAVVTPYLGGVAIYIGFVGAVVSVVGFDLRLIHQSASLLAGATLLLILGLWDDRSGMSPRVKLAGQFVAALIVIASGIRLQLTGHFLLDVPLSVLWIVGLSNAINLSDNMDGLSSGLVAISGAALFVLAAAGGQFLVASMAAALGGACLGFLRYNFSPASIFMGDAGSLFLGFTLAVLALKLRLAHPEPTATVILVLVTAMPILDTTLVTVYRWAHGRPVYVGGQDHCSHRLVALGLSRRAAVLTLYSLAAGFGGLAVALDRSTAKAGWVLTVVAVLAAFLVFLKLGSVAVYGPKAPARTPASADERSSQTS